jgi:hypothetical protein
MTVEMDGWKSAIFLVFQPLGEIKFMAKTAAGTVAPAISLTKLEKTGEMPERQVYKCAA